MYGVVVRVARPEVEPAAEDEEAREDEEDVDPELPGEHGPQRRRRSGLAHPRGSPGRHHRRVERDDREDGRAPDAVQPSEVASHLGRRLRRGLGLRRRPVDGRAHRDFRTRRDVS
jgi:hypothetical protein